MDDDLLTVAQLAQVLQIHACQILEWRNHDQGPPPANDEVIPRWRREDIESWLASRFAEVLDDVEDLEDGERANITRS